MADGDHIPVWKSKGLSDESIKTLNHTNSKIWWKLFKVGLLTFQKGLCYLLDWKPFRSYEKCFLFHLKNSFHSQDI